MNDDKTVLAGVIITITKKGVLAFGYAPNTDGYEWRIVQG
jgi:hypothetical protein